jgi:hypothetical protein
VERTNSKKRNMTQPDRDDRALAALDALIDEITVDTTVTTSSCRRSGKRSRTTSLSPSTAL